MSNPTRTYLMSVIGASALVYSGFELREARRFGINETTEWAQIAELRKELSKPRPPASETTPTGITSTAESTAVPPIPPPDFGLHAKRELSREARLAWGKRLLGEHPDLRQLTIEINASRFGLMYRDFFRARGYSDEQVAGLARRLAEETGMESFWSDYGNFFLPLTNLSEREVSRRWNEILREALGDTGFTEFERFESRWMSHAHIQHVAAMLFDTDQPLTRSECEQLESLFNREVGPSLSITSQKWEAILRDAQPLLSPAQMDALRLEHRQEVVGVVK